MPVLLTLRHCGLILTAVGTALLAFSLKVTPQYSGHMAKVLEELNGPDKLIQPTEAKISAPMFYAGLLLVAVGALMQW